MILFIIHRILRMLLLVCSMVSPLVILLAYWHSIIRQMNASITTFLLFDIHMQLWMNSLVFPSFSLMMTSTMVSRRLVCFLWSRYFYYQQYSSCISFHYLYYCRTVIWILLAYSKISISTSCIYNSKQDRLVLSLHGIYILFFFFWAAYVPWLILYNMPFREASEGYIYSSHLSSLFKNSTYLQDPYTFIKVFSMHSP